MERTIAGIRSDVGELSPSYELLTKGVAALDTKAAATDSDSTGVRGEGFVLRS